MAPFNPAQLSAFFNKMNKQLSTCNAECQRKKRLEQLKTDFVNAQNKVQNSPPELENAEKHYIIEKHGNTYYNNILENRAKAEARRNVNDWNKIINPVFEDLETQINFVESQHSYRKNIDHVKTSYTRELNQLKKEIEETTSKKQVNQRLGYYYSNSSETLNNITYYLKIMYWILVTISIILILYKKKYKQPRYWPYFLFIITFPWLLNLGYTNIMKVFRHFYIDNIYFISVILLLSTLFIFHTFSSIPFNNLPEPQ